MHDDDNPVEENQVLPTQEPANPEPEIELELEAEPEAEEEVEIERAGKKYRIPKALEAELLMQSDYTKKTQGIAEERKALDLMRAEAQKGIEADREEVQALGRLHAMQERVQGYEQAFQGAEWAALVRDNPTRAQQLHLEYTLLRDQRDGLGRELNQRQQQRQLTEQQETAKRIEQGRVRLAQRLPNLKPEKYPELIEFGTKAFEFSRDELGSIQDPRAIEVLYWAQIGKQAHDKMRAKAATPQQPDAQPVPQVNARRAAPVTDLYRITNPEKWAEVRNKELAAKRKASR